MPSADTCPVCSSSPKDLPSWLQCDICSQWFHSMCLKLSADQISSIASYHCEQCAKQHGPSELRRRAKRSRANIDYVALDAGDVFAVDKSEHPHVNKFNAFDVDANESKNMYIDILDDLTVEYATATKLARPILVPQADLARLGMQLPVPRDQISIDYILDKVGDDTSVEVMDVLSQQGVSPGWTMKQWRDYFVSDVRDRIRNVISLEISQVDQLGKQFKRPKMVEDLDLVDKVWQDSQERPQVTKYCLMSVKGSFTDFHIDFGGTSVYYTICKGAKTFLMIPPTDQNLELYTSWCLEPNQNYLWFPDYAKNVKGRPVTPSGGFKVTLHPGDVFIIPSGWIHAVYTPEDSLIIGGNFLMMLSMRKQLQIYNVEKATKVPMKFRHPQFNKVLWLTSYYYMNNPREYSKDVHGISTKRQKMCSPQKIEDADVTSTFEDSKMIMELHDHLQAHYILSKTNQTARKSIPTNLIGKDIERYLWQLKTWSGTMHKH